MAHGCASSAWTIGFYTLHNWMLALFGEQAQEEAFATRPVPRARSAGADGPRRAGGRRHPADRPVVMGHRGDGRQLDHRRRAVRTRRGSSRHLPRVGAVARRRRPDRGRVAHRRHARHRLQRRRHHRRLRPRASAGEGCRHLQRHGARRRVARRRHLPLADGAGPGPAGGDARIRQRRTRRRPLRRTVVTTGAGLRRRHAEGQAHRAGPPGRGPGAAAGACAGCSPTPSARSRPSLPQAIPCHDRCAARPGWRRRTSCTSRGP